LLNVQVDLVIGSLQVKSWIREILEEAWTFEAVRASEGRRASRQAYIKQCWVLLSIELIRPIRPMFLLNPKPPNLKRFGATTLNPATETPEDYCLPCLKNCSQALVLLPLAGRFHAA
jgi:hypothetical protein